MRARRSLSRRLAPLLGLGLGLAVAAASADAGAAGKGGTAASAKKRCIASAENGQTLRANGKLVDARASFAQCTATECPAPVRKDCGHWIDELDAATPSFSLRLEDASGDEVQSGQVQVDGKPVAPSDHGRATPIDPGTHVFEWMRSEGTVRAEVTVHEGEQNKIVLLHVPGPRTDPGAGGNGVESRDGATFVAGAGGGTGAASVPAARPSPVPWIVSGGVALVSAGVGFALWGVGKSEHDDLADSCAPMHTCSSSDVSSSRDKLIVGDVLVGVGIVAAAAGVYFFVKNRNDSHARTVGEGTRAPGVPRASVTPLVTTGGAGFRF